ncbi:MAG: hypothetical protein VX938_12905 [Myxococcota bacterium]|nr:hypothetical protein [Myxococcota bacterium]
MKRTENRIQEVLLSSGTRGLACIIAGLLVGACGGETTPQENEEPIVPVDVGQEVSSDVVATDDAEAVTPETVDTKEAQDEIETEDADASGPETAESPVSACTNPIDLTINNDSGNQVQADAGAFGQSCMGSDDIAKCTSEKLVAKYGLTEGCSSCFAEVLACLVEECLLKCGADPSSDDCTCCKQDKGCTPDFYTCSGLPEDPPIDCGE